jgi:hypothetical protein
MVFNQHMCKDFYISRESNATWKKEQEPTEYKNSYEFMLNFFYLSSTYGSLTIYVVIS